MNLFGIFMNGGDGCTYSYTDVLCRDEKGEMMVFEDETVSELFLMENEEKIRKWNDIENSENAELFIEKIKLISAKEVEKTL